MVKGPDGRLYAGTLDGEIFRFPINADGTLGTADGHRPVRDQRRPPPACPAPRPAPSSAWPSTRRRRAAAPILWVTDNYAVRRARSTCRTGPGRLGAAHRDRPGHVHRGASASLPRSVKDHETNSLAFGPDGALYFNQGANNAMGARRLDLGQPRRAAAQRRRAAPGPGPAAGAPLPLDVRPRTAASYDPYAADAPLTLYATGVRNAFDLVWHRNGHLYVPTNGSAARRQRPGHRRRRCRPRAPAAATPARRCRR